jgi:hypothetical protein
LNESKEDGGHAEAEDQAAPDASGTQRAIQALLDNLHHGRAPVDESPPAPVNKAIDLLHDCAALSRAQERLQTQEKSLDVIFRACISAMIGVLNLFLDPGLSYTWREALMIIAKAQGHGSTCTRSVWTWILDFVWEGRLPLHSYCYTQSTVLDNDEVLQEIQGQLSERAKDGFIKAEDVCEIVASEGVQVLIAQLRIHKPSISRKTAQRYLAKLKYCYSKKKKECILMGMRETMLWPIDMHSFIDGRITNCNSHF